MGEYRTETSPKSKTEFWKHKGDHNLDTYSNKRLPEHAVKSSSGSLQPTPNSAGSKGTSLPPPLCVRGALPVAIQGLSALCWLRWSLLCQPECLMTEDPLGSCILFTSYMNPKDNPALGLFNWRLNNRNAVALSHSQATGRLHYSSKYQPYNLEWLKQAFSLYSHFLLQKHLRKIHCKLQGPEVWIYGYTVPALNQIHCNNYFKDMSGIHKAVQSA